MKLSFLSREEIRRGLVGKRVALAAEGRFCLVKLFESVNFKFKFSVL